MLCNDCHSRDLCTSLCPEALAYANQDWVGLKELPIGLPEYIQKDIQEAEIHNVLNKFSKLSRATQVVTLMKAGFSREQVAQILGISRKNLRLVIYRINKKRYKIG